MLETVFAQEDFLQVTEPACVWQSAECDCVERLPQFGIRVRGRVSALMSEVTYLAAMVIAAITSLIISKSVPSVTTKNRGFWRTTLGESGLFDKKSPHTDATTHLM